MVDYNPARKEIKAAKKSLQALIDASNFEDMEQHWRDCITHVEKSYAKLLNATNPIKGKFSSHFSEEIKVKKTDELLVYVTQARNVDNHSIQDIAKKVNPAIGIRPLHGDNLHIKEIIIDNGVISSYQGGPAIAEFTPESIKTIPVENYKIIYKPPVSHLDSPVPDIHPKTIAELAIEFHEKWIESSSKKFT